jgi:hypothetical protein
LKEYNVPAMGIGLIENGKIKRIEVFGELQNGVGKQRKIVFKFKMHFFCIL